jgi:CheY-like chemotaxis protein
MNRILLADDSPHAQRMGERILREEGFEVVTVTDGETALLRLNDVDPDLILADVFLPSKSGYEICRYVKNHQRLSHIRVVLTAGLLEPIDEEEAKLVQCDGILKKPFEASVVVETIRPLVQAAQYARGLFAAQMPAGEPAASPVQTLELEVPSAVIAPGVVNGFDVDPERVRAAITLALDAALPAMIEELTERVLVALGH